tara:strand:+ start:6 stop:650 length:645 start_codon:yes stop_codon:yes gene_type:complete
MKKYNYNFRPISYFRPKELKDHYGATIKGQKRKELVQENIEIENVPGVIKSQSLSEDLISTFASIHPSYMSGEYLPDLEKDELEIVRIIAKNATEDVTSIRVKNINNKYNYIIVDEYQDELGLEYIFSPTESNQTLTFRQLINLIDSCIVKEISQSKTHHVGLVLGDLEQMYKWSYDDGLEGFFKVESVFYKDISQYYEEKIISLMTRLKKKRI